MIKYLVLIPLLLLALTPPQPFQVPMIANSFLWLWLVLISGFLGVFYIFTKADIILKILSVYLFISCFFSKAPAISFSAYFSVIACLYYYLLCLKLKDWSWVYKSILGVLFLNIIFMLAQFMRTDTVLNFAQVDPIRFGTIGNGMQLKSFIIVLSAFIISYKKFSFIKKYLKQIIVGAVIFCVFYLFWHKVIPAFLYARGPVWLYTLKLSLKEPIFGYGIGTYKALFPALSHYSVAGTEGIWMTAHNCLAQIIFEAGYIGAGLVVAFFGKTFYRVIKQRNLYLTIGMSLLTFTLMVHFPDRMIEAVLIIVAYLAFVNKEINNVSRI